MRIPITRALMPHLPVGTVLGLGASRWYKVRHNPGDFEWASERGGVPRLANDGFFGGERDTSAWHIVALPNRFQYHGNPDGGVE